MSMQARFIDDGGPAFPCITDDVLIDKKAERVIPILRGGMSLRDYFAAKAMQSLIALGVHDDQAAIAAESYEMADAMIAERRTTDSQPMADSSERSESS